MHIFLCAALSDRNIPLFGRFFLIYNPCQIIVFPCKSEKLFHFKVWSTLKPSSCLSLVFCWEKLWKHNEHIHACVGTKCLWKNKQCFCLVQRQPVWEGASLIMGHCFIFPWWYLWGYVFPLQNIPLQRLLEQMNTFITLWLFGVWCGRKDFTALNASVLQSMDRDNLSDLIKKFTWEWVELGPKILLFFLTIPSISL